MISLSNTDLQDLVMHLHLPQALQAKVRFPDGFKPRTSYSVRLSLLTGSDVCREFNEHQAPMGSGRTVGLDGSVVFDGLYPGQYKLYLFTEEPLYLESARLGERDVLASGLSVGAQVGGEFEITLAKANSEIGGTVVSASNVPLAGADVKLVAYGEDAPYVFRSMNAREEGSFLFSGVPPGKYEVVAFSQTIPDVEFGPTEFARGKERAVHVEVGTGPQNVRLIGESSEQR
jgi:hypothetical protein